MFPRPEWEWEHTELRVRAERQGEIWEARPSVEEPRGPFFHCECLSRPSLKDLGLAFLKTHGRHRHVHVLCFGAPWEPLLQDAGLPQGSS